MCSQPANKGSGMNALGVVGAIIGGMIGAAAWAIIGYGTGYELGIIAWALGGLVGFGGTTLGKATRANGVMCAIVALLAMVAGKYATMYLLIQHEQRAAEEQLTEEWFEECQRDAAALAARDDADGYRALLVERGHTDANEPAEVTPDEIQRFVKYSLPRLQWINENDPTYEEWRAYEIDAVAGDATAPAAIIDHVRKDLTAIDALFAILGIATAYKVGAQKLST